MVADLYRFQELVTQNRDVWLLETGDPKHVHDAFGRDGFGDYLADGRIEIVFGLLAPTRRF